MEVVAQVSSGAQVLAAARATSPDVALLDVEMPGGDGLGAAVELRREMPKVKVVMVTAFGRPGFLRRAMESGAAGYLLKDRPAQELACAIRRALVGETIVDPDLALTALTHGANPLSVREIEVLVAARDVPTVADMAATLHLSVGTVRNHLSAAIGKLEARNRGDAVRIAQEQGWMTLP